MYGGQQMEYASTETLFEQPTHPYTIGLLNAVPRLDVETPRLLTIPGSPPNMMNMPKGCPFSPRCEFADENCKVTRPVLTPLSDGTLHRRACLKTLEELS
jgi:oligopeptide transport system ATP-binding protein